MMGDNSCVKIRSKKLADIQHKQSFNLPSLTGWAQQEH